jgi:acetyltransferase-like isoleucine patch superfamily enzyme
MTSKVMKSCVHMLPSSMKGILKRWVSKQAARLFRLFLTYAPDSPLEQALEDYRFERPRIYGDRSRVHISPKAVVHSALINVSSGKVTIGDETFFGHNVSLITGTHNYYEYGENRMSDFPHEGNDIVIEEGVWIGTNATVLGPCRIGKHSVVGACSLVRESVEPYSVVAGIPAKVIKRLRRVDAK